jgi:beta-lactam-binding protein with PASTA domain
MKNKGDGMKSIAMVMVLILAGLTAPGVQAEIYSWTDENGVKHYSHTPPPDRSVPVKTAPEIQPGPTTDQEMEKINEENIDAILQELEKEEQTSAPKPAKTQKQPSRQERIAAEKEKLEDKIAWLEQLPPEAYTNTRSKQAIIGRYHYRMQQLLSNPAEYFKNYGY